ncbi:MAG: S-methyl-5-thioribose-1-phosphate isomerase [candidate division WOR-3 bacterium]
MMMTEMKFPRVLIFRRDCLLLLDQTMLPARTVYRRLHSAAEVARAIKRLQVRGAPWIGVAAGYGLAVEAQRLPKNQIVRGLHRAARLLVRARPTAVNLRWAVEQIMQVIASNRDKPEALRRVVVSAAVAIERREQHCSLAVARNGVRLIPKNGKVLTICNTGILAGPGLGTALGVVYQAQFEGKNPTVFVCETRPLLQGARLTAWELKRSGIEFRLIVDSAAASVIEECDLVIVGADRIAGNGDTANKIGTRMLAVLAKTAVKPFYVAAPSSTFDLKIKTGEEIPIEQRSGNEVLYCGQCRTAPAGSPVYNPAFDVTPAGYISGFITEAGIIQPPYKRNIRRLLIQW